MEVKKWLEENYPKENRNEIEELNIEKKGLEGELDLSDFPNLKKLNCNSNKLTSLNIENCLNIEVIDAWRNEIEEVIGIEKLTHLREVNLAKNKLKELDLTHSVELITLVVHDNPNLRETKIGETHRLLRYNGGSPFDLSQFAALSWTEIIRKRLGEVAERLGIDLEQVKNSPIEKIKELVEKRIDELRKGENNQKPEGLPDDWREQLDEIENLRGKIKQAEEFGLTEWDNLTNQTKNETLVSLLNRPTRNELERVEKERDSRPNITSSELQKLKDNQKPDNLPSNWQELLGKIPGLEKNKNDLKVVQDSLKGWTDKFPGKSPAEVDNENKKAGEVDNLRKELDTWKSRFVGKTPKAVAQEIADANQVKIQLNGWQTKFPNSTSVGIEQELNRLRSQAPSVGQQQKINELIGLVEKQNKVIKEYGDELDDYNDKIEWKSEIVDVSRFR